MSQNFIALDFGSGQITSVLTIYDENTGTCRVRHALHEKCSSVSACYVLDFQKTVQSLIRLLGQMNEYISFTPTVVVGLRGNFLSFRRCGGFLPIADSSGLIKDKDVRLVLDQSIPPDLPENLEVVDLLPQSYSVDGKTGIQNPVGLVGNCLEAETFVSLGLSSHLKNLSRVLAAAGCEDFEAVPTVLALCENLIKPEEKQTGVLLLDIGGANSSAAIYHKGMLEDALELSIGAEYIVQEVADILQNDLKSTQALLKEYAYGDDEIMDEVLDDAAHKLIKQIQKELRQSLSYIKYGAPQAVLTGGGANLAIKNAVKSVLGPRRVRLAAHDDMIADSEDLLSPSYTSALSLALYSQKHGGASAAASSSLRSKAAGLFEQMLAKLGLN